MQAPITAAASRSYISMDAVLKSLVFCRCCPFQLICNTEGTILTAGLKCSDIGGKEGCGGMLAGTSGSSHNRYLCNQTCLAVRHYLAKYYNSAYVCDDCGAASKVCDGGGLSYYLS